MISITQLIYEGTPSPPPQQGQPYSQAPTSFLNKLGLFAGAALPVLSLAGMALTGFGQSVDKDPPQVPDKEHPGRMKMNDSMSRGMAISGVGMMGTAALTLPRVLKNTGQTYKNIRAQQEYEKALKMQQLKEKQNAQQRGVA